MLDGAGGEHKGAVVHRLDPRPAEKRPENAVFRIDVDRLGRLEDRQAAAGGLGIDPGPQRLPAPIGSSQAAKPAPGRRSSPHLTAGAPVVVDENRSQPGLDAIERDVPARGSRADDDDGGRVSGHRTSLAPERTARPCRLPAGSGRFAARGARQRPRRIGSRSP